MCVHTCAYLGSEYDLSVSRYKQGAEGVVTLHGSHHLQGRPDKEEGLPVSNPISSHHNHRNED